MNQLVSGLVNDYRIDDCQSGNQTGHATEGVADDQRIPAGIGSQHIVNRQRRAMRAHNVCSVVEIHSFFTPLVRVGR